MSQAFIPFIFDIDKFNSRDLVFKFVQTRPSITLFAHVKSKVL